MQPILLIESGTPGLLYVNGQFCGELTEPQPFPSWPDGRALIEFRPLGRSALPMACALTLKDGLLQPHGQEGVFCVQWPDGVAQVELRPQRLEGTPVLTDIGCGLTLAAREGSAAILRGEEIVQPLPPGARDVNAKPAEAGGCVATGRCAAGMFVCCVPPPGRRIGDGASGFLLARTVKWERADLVRAVSGGEDTVGHGMLSEYRVDAEGLHLLSSQPVWTDGAPRWPQSAQETLRAYLEARHAGLDAEANGYLSSPGVGGELPPFDAVLPLRYPLCRPPAGCPLAMGVMRVREAGLACVTAVCARARDARGRQGNYCLDAMQIYA